MINNKYTLTIIKRLNRHCENITKLEWEVRDVCQSVFINKIENFTGYFGHQKFSFVIYVMPKKNIKEQYQEF